MRGTRAVRLVLAEVPLTVLVGPEGLSVEGLDPEAEEAAAGLAGGERPAWCALFWGLADEVARGTIRSARDLTRAARASAEEPYMRRYDASTARSPVALAVLSWDCDREVRKAVAENRRTPARALDRLALDPDPAVRDGLIRCRADIDGNERVPPRSRRLSVEALVAVIDYDLPGWRSTLLDLVRVLGKRSPRDGGRWLLACAADEALWDRLALWDAVNQYRPVGDLMRRLSRRGEPEARALAASVLAVAADCRTGVDPVRSPRW